MPRHSVQSILRGEGGYEYNKGSSINRTKRMKRVSLVIVMPCHSVQSVLRGEGGYEYNQWNRHQMNEKNEKG